MCISSFRSLFFPFPVLFPSPSFHRFFLSLSIHMPLSTPSSFTLSLSFRSAEHDEPIAFKVDGARFEGGSRSLKFAIDTKYKVTIETKPHVEFHHLHIGGSDLAITVEGISSGKYGADWNTTGITPTKRGARENIGLNLQGPGGVLRTKLQCKFYKKEDSHATWGHKMNGLQWCCTIDGAGNISLGEENIK